jgi:PilZ domain
MSMMQVSAYLLDEGAGDERRGGRRLRANVLAIMRQQKRPNEAIQIVDISVDGCRFRAHRPVPVGGRLWLALPGLDTWEATVAWFRDGQGGLRFERPLHPQVAARLAANGGDGDR